MHKISFKDGFGFVSLSRNFYTKEAILKTFEVYRDFLEISILELKAEFLVKFKSITNDYSIEVLIQEFLNYLLSVEYEVLNKRQI